MIRLKRLFTPVPSLDADQAGEFMEKHREGEYTLLDVRQPEEYEREHIPGSKLIPLPAFGDSLAELDPKKPIVAY